jgi:hypothetical protein
VLGIRRRTSGSGSVTVCGAEAPTTCRGATHGEAEAQEGQVGHFVANRDWVTRTDSHADEGPVDDQRRWLRILGFRPVRPEVPPPR